MALDIPISRGGIISVFGRLGIIASQPLLQGRKSIGGSIFLERIRRFRFKWIRASRIWRRGSKHKRIRRWVERLGSVLAWRSEWKSCGFCVAKRYWWGIHGEVVTFLRRRSWRSESALHYHWPAFRIFKQNKKFLKKKIRIIALTVSENTLISHVAGEKFKNSAFY